MQQDAENRRHHHPQQENLLLPKQVNCEWLTTILERKDKYITIQKKWENWLFMDGTVGSKNL
jgi:hypothetical protein